jgi:hypothetical protein
VASRAQSELDSRQVWFFVTHTALVTHWHNLYLVFLPTFLPFFLPKFRVSGQFIIMPRAQRARIGRIIANATRTYNRRQQNNTPERSQTLAQEQRNALSMKSAFNYQSEIDYLNIKALKIGRMTILCPKCHAKNGKMKPMDFAALTVKLFYTNLRIFQT